jgi:phage terminase large subunit-like protein
MVLTYGHDLAMETATTMRRLIGTPWYQNNWGNRVKITSDQDAKLKFDTSVGGYRMSSSMSGATLGRGGDIRIIDDPLKVDEAESELVRDQINRTYEEALQHRVTDPKTTATVIIAQRLHADDLCGHVLDLDDEFVHLCLPCEYEPWRKCHTVLGWEDPRTIEGELICPDRWGAAELQSFKSNAYLWASQYQQRPEIRGGAIIKREYWKIWDYEAMDANDIKRGLFPTFEFVLASFDGAYTVKEENDFSALTVWGVWIESTPEQRAFAGGDITFGTPRLMLIHAWRKKLPLHGRMSDITQLPGETKEAFKLRQLDAGGIIEHLIASCKKFNVDHLLIESKATGITVEQEMKRLAGNEGFGIQLISPGRLDKAARAWTVQPVFVDGAVWRPDTDWAQLVEDELANLRGKGGGHDDLADTAVQAISYLRKNSMAPRAIEAAQNTEYMLYDRPRKPSRARAFYES